MMAKTDDPNVDVVICVHNALEDVQKCYESVGKTAYPAEKLRIILIDDGSDKPTQSYLETVASAHAQTDLIRREKAGGYTIAANTGLRASKAEFICLLNSDTIVPPSWLKKMTRVFADHYDVGIVGPLSNAASWQSVPDLSAPEGGWAINELPQGWDVGFMDAFISEQRPKDTLFPRVPLVNGFCYMLRRNVIETIGLLDEEGFPRGFGEEDDFCFRAANAGFGLMIATNTFVYHAKSKSYGSTKRNELAKKGGITLRKKHSEARLMRSVDSMRKNPLLAEMRHLILNGLNAN